MNSFVEVAIILSMATVAGMVGRLLRQPLIIMFLATGIVAGPSFLSVVKSHDQIELLAQIGIALLLFIVGLKLDISLIRSTGMVALATGMGQIVFTSIFGFAIAIMLGMSFLTSAYLAVALTFSSTIIIVKLLSDKKEIDSLHGQIAIGFLIVQDIAAILALIALTTFGSSVGKEGPVHIIALIVIAKGIGFLGAIALMMKYVLPGLTTRLAHSLELLTLFAIAWAVVLGAGSELLGFSKEVGAFLAGVSLASTSFRDSIGARLTGLRDFLLLFFFIDLGARLNWSAVGSQLGSATIFSIFVLIGNPLIVLIIMGLMGYRRRTSLLAGLTVAQISEFSLIVAALGLSLGHISNETVGLITLVGVITIFVSTYMILYSGPLYSALSRILKIFERKIPYREAAIDTLKEISSVDAILLGLGNYGSGLAEYLTRRNKKILAVDFDPVVLEKWRKIGLPVLYGDMTDPDILEHLPLHRTKWILSTVRSKEINMALIANLKKEHYQGRLAITASNDNEAAEFKNAGADLVFRPFSDAAEQAVDSLTHTGDLVPADIRWPVGFRELRVKSDVVIAGKTIRDNPIRTVTGVSILAVTRGGKIYYEPDPDFSIFPGDRLLIMGPPHSLSDAEEVLNQLRTDDDDDTSFRFELAEIRVAENSELSGRTLAESGFRQKYGVTLVGIRRNNGEEITSVSPTETIMPGDRLIIIGNSAAVEIIKNKGKL